MWAHLQAQRLSYWGTDYPSFISTAIIEQVDMPAWEKQLAEINQLLTIKILAVSYSMALLLNVWSFKVP